MWDYSTGQQYNYNGNSGSWNSIQAQGGQINPQNQGPGQQVSVAVQPAYASGASVIPFPYAGAPGQQANTFSTPTLTPYVSGTSTYWSNPTATNYPGLPAGWTVTNSGRVLPPNSACVSRPPRFLCTLFLGLVPLFRATHRFPAAY